MKVRLPESLEQPTNPRSEYHRKNMFATLLRESAGLQLHTELQQDLRQSHGSVDSVCAGVGIGQNQAGSRASVRVAAVRFERVVDRSEEVPDSG